MNRAPLDGRDPERAGALKRKVLARLTDVTRHYRALEVAIQEFGEGFDRTQFVQASESEEPVALNHVKAVERGLDQLFNYVAELAALGLELAEIRQPEDPANTREDLRRIRDLGVLAGEACGQLVRVAAIRNRMVHDYVGLTAADVHDAVRLLQLALPEFVSGYHRHEVGRGERDRRVQRLRAQVHEAHRPDPEKFRGRAAQAEGARAGSRGLSCAHCSAYRAGAGQVRWSA